MTTPCKYGDPYCPCQDGDLCHYEGVNPMRPPGYVHLAGAYWSDGTWGRTWTRDGEEWRRTTHDEIGTLTAYLAHEQLAGRRPGIYCPGCEECVANAEEGTK